MNFDEFLSKYKVGQSYGYNGTYVGQCVSLVKNYIKEVLGVTPQAIGDAKEYWNKRNTAYIKDVFTPIANTPSFIPKKGDVFVRTSGECGHIGIVLEATKNYFYTIEQNYNGCKVVKNIKHTDWSNINFLRPKQQSNIVSAPVFKVGNIYTLTTNVKVRTGAGTNYAQKKANQLTEDGRKNCTSTKSTDYAVLKKGTKVTAKSMKTVSCDVWLQIPSGWICAYYKGEYYVK